MKYTIASGLIGAAVLFQQVAMPEEAQAQSDQEQMRDVMESNDLLQQILFTSIQNVNLEGVRHALDQGAVPSFPMLKMIIQGVPFILREDEEWAQNAIIDIYELITDDMYMKYFTQDELSEALYKAASPGYVPAVEKLIEYGADPNKRFDNHSPEMAIGLAASNLILQIEQDSRSIDKAEKTVLAFIQGGTTRQAVADSGLRPEVKDRIFGIMDSVGLPLLSTPDPALPRP